MDRESAAEAVGRVQLAAATNVVFKPIRVEVFLQSDGATSREPLAFVELDDPKTAAAEIAAVLRKLADEFEELAP